MLNMKLRPDNEKDDTTELIIIFLLLLFFFCAHIVASFSTLLFITE